MVHLVSWPHKLEAKESARLKSLLGQAPTPTPWGWRAYPSIAGPDNKSLVWKEENHVVRLVDKSRETVIYLALSFYCYLLQTTENRILIWHHVGSAMSPTAVRVHLFKTPSLRPVDRMPVYNNLAHDESSQIAYVEGGHKYADIPTQKTRGIHSFTFPDEMKTIGDTAILVSGTDKSVRDPLGSGFPGVSVYILEFAANRIEAVPLDWWNDSDADFGYLWIQRIILDPRTGGLVGDGKGALPFVMYRDRKKDSRWVKHNL